MRPRRRGHEAAPPAERRLRREGWCRRKASYARLVKCAHISNGKTLGSAGAKIGNAYLKWAFSEAAVLFVAKSELGRTLLKRLERKHGKSKALALLAHKIGRTVYFMLARKRAFDPQRFAAAA